MHVKTLSPKPTDIRLLRPRGLQWPPFVFSAHQIESNRRDVRRRVCSGVCSFRFVMKIQRTRDSRAGTLRAFVLNRVSREVFIRTTRYLRFWLKKRVKISFTFSQNLLVSYFVKIQIYTVWVVRKNKKEQKKITCNKNRRYRIV